MYYIKNEDYEYIKNKYHDSSKPWKNDSNRFICNEGLFDEKTGLSPEEVIAGIWENDKKYENLPHPVRKARAFEFVLKNTRISCDARDRFPAICSIDRPINKTLVAAWRKEVFGEMIPEVEAKRREYEKKGMATIWPDYDHSVPVWDRVFALGFTGILKEAGEAAEKHKGILSEKETAFFEGIDITYNAIIDFVGRLIEISEDEKLNP